MSHTEFSWQSARGLRIAAQDWKPEGEIRAAVGLVHGLGEHAGRYQHVVEAFNRAGYSVTSFDLPGHGKSAGTRGHASYKDILEDIDRLLEEISQRYPGKPCFLYGHSMGGALVLYYTLKRRPDLRGVIATSPGLAPAAPVPGPKLMLAKVMARLLPSFTMENGLELAGLSHEQANLQAYQGDPLVHPRISASLGLDLLTLGQWMIEHAGEFPVPLLLVQGSKDIIVSPQATAAFAKAAPQKTTTFKVWEGMYHETHNEPEKEQVVQYLVSWINSQV